MSQNAVQLAGLVFGFAGACLHTVAILRADWRISDPGGPGKSMSKSWIHIDGFWKECIGYTTGEWHCDGFGDFFLRFSTYLILGRTLMIVTIGCASLAVFLSLAGMNCSTMLPEDSSIKHRVYKLSVLLFLLSAISATVITLWSAIRTSSEFYACVQQQRSGQKVNKGQCMRFGQALYIAFGATSFCYMALICGACSSNQTNDPQDRPVKMYERPPYVYNKTKQTQEYI
nr:claudin-6-like [Ciona intestinalis]|eukprot:XP_002123178.1 claudin-6-like [Ciona intestinalis]